MSPPVVARVAALSTLLLACLLWFAGWREARETRLLGKSVRAWAFASIGPHPQERKSAAEVLGAAGERALPDLIRMVRTPDPPLTPLLRLAQDRLPEFLVRYLRSRVRPADASAARMAGAHALGLLGPQADAAVPALAHLFMNGSPAERWTAATALGRIATPSAVRVCMQVLLSTNQAHHHPAVYALGQMGCAAAEAAPLLVQTLGHPDAAVRASAADALGRVSHEPSRLLLASAQTGPLTARQEAAQALTRNPPSPRTGVAPLLELLQDPDPSIRRHAAQTLKLIASQQPRVQEALDRLQSDPDPIVRQVVSPAHAGPNHSNSHPTEPLKPR
jgi:hypothetical protein